MLKSPWIRKPDFTNLKPMDYEGYWKHRGFKINADLKPREEIMLSIIPLGAKVLDIGCGNSLLPVKLKEKGVKVSVADVSKLVLSGYQKYDVSGIIIDLEKVSEINLAEKYDFIILSEVLEHLKNPEEVIAKLRPYTKEFLITVPNSAAYVFRYCLMFRGRFFTQWIYHPSEHLRYWSHIDFLDWLSAMKLTVTKSIPADGLTFRGLLPWLPKIWKNFLGYRMVYRCTSNG